MCGLFGMISSTVASRDQRGFLMDAMVVGTLRGWDSTGIMIADKDNDIKIVKAAQPGPEFVSGKHKYKVEAAVAQAFVAIGHNRAATKGAVSDKTAHPFRFGDIVGAHNGTLSYNSGLPINSHSVDSMNLYDSLSRITDPTPDKYIELIKQIQGSYALTWYHIPSETLWVVRNPARPLTFVKDGAGDMYWTSETGMVKWLLERNKLEFVDAQVADVTPHTLYQIDTRELKVVSSTPYKPHIKASTYTGRGLYRRDGSALTTPSTSTDTSTGGSVRGAHSYMDSEIGMYTKYLSPYVAIKEGLIDKEDEKGVVIVPVKDSDSSQGTVVHRKFVCEVYTHGGGMYLGYVWGKAADIKIGSVYIGDISTVVVPEEFPDVVVRFSLHANSMNRLNTTDEQDAAMIEDMRGTVAYVSDWREEINEELRARAKKEARGNKSKEGKPSKQQTAAKKEEKVVPINTPKKKSGTEIFRGPGNSFLGRDAFIKMVGSGCGHCHEPITPEEHEKIGWLNNKQPICESCLEIVEETFPVQLDRPS